MPGFWYAGPRQPSDEGPMIRERVRLASSLTAFTGDPVVLTTVSGSTARQRPLVAADKTALYENATNDVCGIFGITEAGWVTDANGVASTAPAPVSVNALVQPIYALPTMAYGNAPDQAGRSVANVILFDPQNLIGGYLWENTTITHDIEDTLVGILISTIATVPTFFWSSAATVKVARIIAPYDPDPKFNKTVTANVQDTTHNLRCPIRVQPLAQYSQNLTGFNYAT